MIKGKTKTFNLYTDGSGTKGITGFAAYIKELRKYATGTEIHGTVNTAEWKGLQLGLKLCRRLQKEAGGTNFIIHMDSQLVVKQFNGEYANNSFTALQENCEWIAREIQRGGGSITVKWIPRDENTWADKAANYARVELTKAYKATIGNYNFDNPM